MIVHLFANYCSKELQWNENGKSKVTKEAKQAIIW